MQFSTGNWLHKFHHVGRAKDGNEVTQKSVATSKLGNTKKEAMFQEPGIGERGPGPSGRDPAGWGCCEEF